MEREDLWVWRRGGDGDERKESKGYFGVWWRDGDGEGGKGIWVVWWRGGDGKWGVQKVNRWEMRNRDGKKGVLGM